MKLSAIAERLWGSDARLRYLFLASFVLLFTLLGGREIWTQEHRWADIVSGMFFRHDYLHPYLGMNRYYDKPLLSYWLIVLLAKLNGALTVAVLRLPSAIAAWLAIFSLYTLGAKLKNKKFGLMAGWMLLTTFYFVFWARTSSADMLNLAGSLAAVAWYFNHRDRARFFDYCIFFIILALTSLCKGLVGAMVPLIAVAIDIFLQRSYRHYLRLSVALSLLPAIFLYLLPFWASSHIGGLSYGQDGLALVYRENILRYFQPFDHQGPFYTYFIYLPVYLLPWALLFIPALLTLPSRFKTLSCSSRWMVYTLFALFLFFTLSGSRRSYYILPMVPFAILFIADWIMSDKARVMQRQCLVALMTVFAFVFIFIALDVAPAWYYAKYGVNQFAATLVDEASKIQPWQRWHVVMLDAESKLNFYLELPPETPYYGIQGKRAEQTATELLETWPILNNKPANTIFISRKQYASLLQGYFIGYRMIVMPKTASSLPFLKEHDLNVPIAFIPPR